MLNNTLRACALAALPALLLCLGPARAGVQEGVAAFHNGDYVSAYAEFEAVLAASRDNPPVLRPPSPSAPKPRAAAEYYLSRMYIEGRGVGVDRERGLDLLRRAAHQEYPAALVALSERYRTGEGVMQNRREAQRMMRRAVALGDAQAAELWAAHYQDDPAEELADLREAGEIPAYITTQPPVPTEPVSRAVPRGDRLNAPLPSSRANDVAPPPADCPTSSCARGAF